MNELQKSWNFFDELVLGSKILNKISIIINSSAISFLTVDKLSIKYFLSTVKVGKKLVKILILDWVLVLFLFVVTTGGGISIDLWLFTSE